MAYKSMKVVVCLSVSIALGSGCVIRGSGSGLAIGADVALAASGALMWSEANSIQCRTLSEEDRTHWPLVDMLMALDGATCEAGKKARRSFGQGALVAGAIGLLATILVNNAKRPPRKAPESGSGVDFSGYVQQPPQDPDPHKCAEELAAFRNESNDKAKLRLLENMRDVCRAQLSSLDTR